MNATDARRYRVEHRTSYRYSAPVSLSHQQLHLTPRPVGCQQVHSHEVRVTPEPTLRHESRDPFGNPVTVLTLETAHDTLDVVARSTIEVSSRVPSSGEESPPWESVREALTYRASWEPDAAILEAAQFLFESPHVRVKRDLRQYASDCFPPGRSLFAAVHALMGKIHTEFKFDATATTVTTSVLSFFEKKRGVCQDFSHFMISCLRSLGLAARYVSGYLLTHPPPGKPRRIGADASHAWVAVFVPGVGWIDFDPTNNLVPSVEHITIGWGRDFLDVTPVRGVIHGGGTQTLEVKVTVIPVR
ncbi:MAG: transglutaminase family protein [Deltaproteobacteria bacterium]|nr:transglutaminase family protein [Deltaproteobacteria bacterium]